jgi:hypothetical protein
MKKSVKCIILPASKAGRVIANLFLFILFKFFLHGQDYLGLIHEITCTASFFKKTATNKIPTGCFTPIGVYKKLATLNPENIPVNVISIDI